MKILLANPRGFCAGVDRAIEIVERAIEQLGPPVYVRHEVVHNRFVVDRLRGLGAVFVEEVDEVPEGAICIFSAHGVSQAVRGDARKRGLTVFDATCPLVTKVHIEVAKYSREGREVVLIGHRGHPEVEGTMGQFDSTYGGAIFLVETVGDVQRLPVRKPDRLAYVTQTTLSMDDTARIIDALRARFPQVHGPRKDDICYATQNRQDAVRELAPKVELLLVVGAHYSSNSNRLRDLGAAMGIESHLIASADDMKPSWLVGVETVGISAGASAPEELVQGVITRLSNFGEVKVSAISKIEENITFKLPRELLDSPIPPSVT